MPAKHCVCPPSGATTLARLLEGLRAETRKRHGHIGELELRASFRRGGISDLYSGRKTCTLEELLRALDALEADHVAFFSWVLGGRGRPEACLEQLEVAGERDAALSNIERATRRLAAEPPPADPLAVVGAAGVAEVAGCKRHEQQRRLRHTRKIRTHAFTRAYLEHLDALRYDHAEEAAKLATTVAVDLVPVLPGPPAERLALQCLALGVFGSARRLKGKFTAAARAFQLALAMAREHRLREDVARLLQRASYLLRDFGQLEQGLICLREALEIYVDLGSNVGISRVLIDRGMMLTLSGDHETAVLALREALRRLEGNEAALPRYHFAAYQYLAYAFEQFGDLDAAEALLAEATGIGALEHGFYWAKLRWLQGTLAFKRGVYPRAEVLIRSARGELARTESSLQQAVVTLDLLDSLLVQDKVDEAVEEALATARLVTDVKKNRLADAAIVQLVTAAFEGRLTQKTVREVRARLEKGRAPERGAPRRL